MKSTLFFLVIIIIPIQCEVNSSQIERQLFPEMKNINYMKNINSNKFKKFVFHVSDTLITHNNNKYYKFNTSFIGVFYLNIKNNELRHYISYQEGVYSKGTFMKIGEKFQYLDFPMFGYEALLKSKKYYKKYRDTMFIYECNEIETYDVDGPKNNSITIQEFGISKKRGLTYFIIKSKITNEVYEARYFTKEELGSIQNN